MVSKKKEVLGMNVSLGAYQSFIETIVLMAKEEKSSYYICVANVHMLVEAYSNVEFSSVVNNADLVTPDGMPLTKALKTLYGIDQDRVAGMDLLPDLLGKSEEQNIPVYFYGGTEAMLASTESYCKKYYPNLNLVGLLSPPFRPLTLEEETTIIEKINASGAKFVFVALGCPKQEKWMASMKGRINACMIGIGGALPVLIGMQKRAPKWMQKYSLEWLYRLGQEPKRLFKRYAVTNTTFLYLLFKQLAKQGFKQEKY